MYNINGRSGNLGMILPMSNANVNGTGYMLNETVKYATTQLGLVIISTANSNRDGTGTIGNLITGTSNGTIVKRIVIKAQGNTSEGMIRLFHYDGTTTRLVREIPVPAITQSSEQKTFIAVINEPFFLKLSNTFKVSTEKAETFIATAEGTDMSYPALP